MNPLDSVARDAAELPHQLIETFDRTAHSSFMTVRERVVEHLLPAVTAPEGGPWPSSRTRASRDGVGAARGDRVVSRRRRWSPQARAGLAAGLALTIAACGTVGRPPEPTPESIPGVLTVLAAHGIAPSHIVSGDPGCDDATLRPTAASFEAAGLDQAGPLAIHLYVFRNRSAFDRLRDDVDACARSYITAPDEYVALAVSPYVATFQGPVAPVFRASLEAALVEAAGRGD